MNAPVIQCLEVTKHFGSAVVVDNVTFSVDQGEILSILGPSGAGKTTLLRLIAGFEVLDGGKIQIGDRRMSTPQNHLSPERRNVGMVFQEFALFPHMDVSQNIAFGLIGLNRQEIHKRTQEVLDLVRLSGLERRYPYELSGGQQQRVALARTLAPRPVTVLLDEPFSNIDASMRAEMRQEMQTVLRNDRTSAVFVSHDREEAFAMADRIGVMVDGRLDQIDTPDSLYYSPATPFVARMSGMSDFLAGTVKAQRVVTELGDLLWTSNDENCVEGTKVDLLVHFEDFRVLAAESGQATVVSREFRGDDIILTIKAPLGTMIRCRQDRYSSMPLGTRVTLEPARSTPFLVFKTAL